MFDPQLRALVTYVRIVHPEARAHVHQVRIVDPGPRAHANWVMIVHPGDKKHEPSKLNYYTFDDELTPMGVSSLSSPQQMDVVYQK